MTSLLPGLLIMAVGRGAVAAAGLLSASRQLGRALGLAAFSAIAAARTRTLLAALITLRVGNTSSEPPAQPRISPAATAITPNPAR